MIRLTALLCGGMFLFLLIAGEDNGQVRQGLMTPPALVQAPAPVKAPAPVVEPAVQITEAVFVPAQPVRVQPVAPTPVIVEPESEPVEAQIPDRLAVVTARSANVRSGPSTSDAVIGRLNSGEEVLVVLEENAVEGWSLVRIEGDGVTGYVASRLLRPVTP